ncbi:MFS transporter [Sphingomonas sp.]|jgi:MFS family permease|uniref:spinster family MFS transporter n=1 Tax=Sphingomonas sp. TaxID=28214 RepID=UPI002D7FDB29|nr:MFS transporter [Sphingomonas sp.]HEU0044019.1 MFS transporter [Sphingomonas sp.]
MSDALAGRAPPMPEEVPVPTGGYRWYVVGVLILAYTFSYIDRSILTLMVGPIRASLGISDVELSMLHGLAFALFYTICGIPIGRLVDRRRRTTIIAVGVAFWSGMTALCGLAQNFVQMFLARIGVGVGEAALSPAAYSSFSDWFEGKQLTRALSLYNSAIYVGGGLATMAGGALIASVPAVDTALLGRLEPWRVVFILVGLPGFLIALLVLALREPARRGLTSPDIPSFRAVLAYLWLRRGAFGWLIGGLAISSLMWNGVIAWAPAHFMRNFGWTPAEVGARYGLALIVFGSAGVLFGGWLAGMMRDRGRRDANVRIGVISALAALPFGVAAPLMPTGATSLALFCGFLFAGTIPYGGAAAALQEMTPNRMRGQVTAIYLFCLNLVGIGLGPVIVALFTEQLYGGDASVRYSIATIVAIAAPISALVMMAACRSMLRWVR